MSLNRDTIIHLVAGGTGGTVGAIVTCPLEVVKTRLQSSVASFHVPLYQRVPGSLPSAPAHIYTSLGNTTATGAATAAECQMSTQTFGIWRCLRHIVDTEGVRALFKGLGPNLVGVAPSRAIYFCAYAQSKVFLNNTLPTPESPLCHMCSAVCAGFIACTATNPIWFVKTRLQLDVKRDGRQLTTSRCIRNVYKTSGVRGFYKGITASYYGISETVIHFVIYEWTKAKLKSLRHNANGCSVQSDDKTSRDFMEFMLSGAISKTCASILAYPHEVARTRLRQEGDKYLRFWQTLFLVAKEEGVKGVYRGLGTQLVRQIPNTAIMMATYEAIVYMLTRYSAPKAELNLTTCCADNYADDEPSLTNSYQ